MEKTITLNNYDLIVCSNGDIYTTTTMLRGIKKQITRRLIAQTDNGNGYKIINLYRKNYYVHRVVATAFIPNTEKLKIEYNTKQPTI